MKLRAVGVLEDDGPGTGEATAALAADANRAGKGLLCKLRPQRGFAGGDHQEAVPDPGGRRSLPQRARAGDRMGELIEVPPILQNGHRLASEEAPSGLEDRGHVAAHHHDQGRLGCGQLALHGILDERGQARPGRVSLRA